MRDRDPHHVPEKDGALIRINSVRRFMRAKGIRGKGKKKFRKELRRRARAKVASVDTLLEGLVNAPKNR